MQETEVRFLGQEDPLEKEMATHSSILPWKIPWTEEPGRLHTVHGIPRVGHDLATKPPAMLHSHCSEARGFCSLLSYSETQSNGTNCLLQYYQLPRPTERGLWKVLYKESNVLAQKRSAQNSLARISHMVLFNHMLYEAHPSFEKKEGELCMW